MNTLLRHAKVGCVVVLMGALAISPNAQAQCDLLDEHFDVAANFVYWGVGSIWQVLGGVLQISGSNPNPDPAAYLNPTAPASVTWTDYSVSCKFRTPGDYVIGTDMIGIVFRYTDPSHYYVLRIDGVKLGLFKRDGGSDVPLPVPTVDRPLEPAHDYTAQVTAINDPTTPGNVVISAATISDAGVPIVVFPGVTDTPSSALLHGTVGVTCRRAAVGFDDVCVTSVTAGGETWTSSTITPNPVGPVSSGGLKVTIVYSGGVPPMVYALPQGVADADTAHWIRFSTPTPAGAGSGIWEATNITPIRTAFDHDGPPRPGDVLMDGHAVVWIAPKPLNTDTPGRHFLIDTIPPRIIAGQPPNVDEWLLVINVGPYAAFGAPFLTPTHPYAPAEGTAQMNLDINYRNSKSPFVAYDPEPKAILNIGSVANGLNVLDPAHPELFQDRRFLKFAVNVEVLDVDVYNSVNPPLVPTSADVDSSTGSTDRQVAGFLNGSFGPGDPGTILAGGPGGLAPFSGGGEAPVSALWLVGSDGMSALGAVQIRVNSNTYGNNPGFFNDYTMANSAHVAWYFGAETMPPTGIRILDDSGQPLVENLHISGMFVGQDRVGNKSNAHPDPAWSPREPLHIWWLSGANLSTPVWKAGSNGLFPDFKWSLNRTMVDLNIAGGSPAPQYTYSLYYCTEPGEASKNGPYRLMPHGSGNWSPATAKSGADLLSEVQPYNPPELFSDHWFLFVVAGMDEAGNVEPWPAAELDPPVNDQINNVYAGGDAGRNWMRFFIPPDTGAVDTTLSVDFRYSDNLPEHDFGAATLITYPQAPNVRILGLFDVGVVARDPNPFVLIELEREGDVIFRVGLPAGGGQVRVLLADDANTPPSNRVPLNTIPSMPAEVLPPTGAQLALGDAGKAVNYVFRATTVSVGYSSTGQLAPALDATPANFSFKVIPKTVEDGLKSIGGEQPIKVFERE